MYFRQVAAKGLRPEDSETRCTPSTGPMTFPERPDPNTQVFVRTAPDQICPDGARPTQNFCNFVWTKAPTVW